MPHLPRGSGRLGRTYEQQHPNPLHTLALCAVLGEDCRSRQALPPLSGGEDLHEWLQRFGAANEVDDESDDEGDDENL